jgi:sec-independent protein translocase protein TatA
MSFGITELIIILVIVLLMFGSKKLSSLGSDLGSAIKGFRSAVSEEPKSELAEDAESPSDQKTGNEGSS